MNCAVKRNVTDYGARENIANNAPYIQAAIDACDPGDTVFFPKGNYTLGTVRLKSNITLELSDGTVLNGSEDYRDYCKDEKWEWTSALFRADNCENITVKGKALLDGHNCFCPQGVW